jgi:hypothetical protein
MTLRRRIVCVVARDQDVALKATNTTSPSRATRQPEIVIVPARDPVDAFHALFKLQAMGAFQSAYGRRHA